MSLRTHKARFELISLKAFSTVFLFISLVSCTAQVDTNEYPTLPARFAIEGPQQPMAALEALLDNESFYIRYKIGDEILYTGGDWASRIDLEALITSGVRSGPYIVPMRYHRSERWTAVPEAPVTATILGSDKWQSFRDEFLVSVLPKAEHAGIVLHFFIDDYFLYLDEDGVFQSVPLLEKPGDYTISKQISFADFLEEGLPLLKEFLANSGIDERRVLFNTGDTGTYSLPFLYVNLDLPIAVFVRHQPVGRSHDPGRAVPIVQTAGHLTQSHSVALLYRPISSVYRLFFVATNTIAEAARPDWLVALESTPIQPVSDGPGMDLEAWEARIDKQTGRKSSKATIEYLVDGEEFFTRFIDAMTSAEQSIDLRTYIFDNDDYAERIANLLKRRSNEGIDVRMLFDGLGTIVSTIEQQQTLPDDWKGASSMREFLTTDSQIDVRQSSNPWLTGDHVKTIVIDRRTAFTGGMNIAREYRYDWHDLMMEIHGPVVDILQDEFNKAWAHAGAFGDYAYFARRLMPASESAEDVGYPVRVLFTRPDDAEIFRVQTAAIRNAKRRIYVENAYFTDDALLYELVKARRRGVDVRVIMPLVTDRGPITRNNALAANVMLENGIRVYIFPGMSHVKAAIFDGWACLGSANWDKWSLAINKELNIATSHPEAVNELVARVFEQDFSRSPELTEPFPERWSDHLLEFLGDYVF